MFYNNNKNRYLPPNDGKNVVLWIVDLCKAVRDQIRDKKVRTYLLRLVQTGRSPEYSLNLRRGQLKVDNISCCFFEN